MHPLAAKSLFDSETHMLTATLEARRGWIIHLVEFPVIDCSFTEVGRTTLRLRMQCEDWNDLPPSITLHAADGTFLSTLPPNPSGVFHVGPHPVTNRPFVCMRGSREYHTHPSHVTDLWDNLKCLSRYELGGILTQVWNAWLKGNG